MSQSPDQVAAAIIATLKQTIPGLSLATGTPERSLIDACATQISAAMISQYLTGGMLDINTKAGLELDQFVGIFGFGRLQGSSATGVVTLTRASASTSAINIPVGSQYYTTAGIAGATQTLHYASTQAVTIPAGQFTCTLPVKCTAVGTAGNVPPDSITSQSAALGASTVTNLQAMTGGVNVETDAALRQRFMDTLLRNIAGTSDWYTNLALQNNAVARVAVYGPIALYRTQIAVPSSTLTLPVTSDVKYAFSTQSSCFQNLGTGNEVFYSDINDYSLSPGASPVFTRTPTGTLVAGQIVDVEFQYTPKASRNDPVNGITNKVDVFVDGVSPFTVTETTVVPAQTLSTVATSPYYTGNFVRVGETTPPSATNRFMALGSVPVINFPTSITVAGVVYTKGVAYHLLKGITTLRGSQLEVAGIEWETGIATGTQLTLNYTYNQIPELLDAITKPSKQICTDVLTHVADYQFITTCLTVEYARNYAIATVNTAIVSRLQIFFQALGFGAPVIFSQLVAAVQQVLGVNEVHVTTATEAGTGNLNYGIWVLGDSATAVTAPNIMTGDFVLSDSQIAVYQNVITRQAPNIGGGGT